MKSWDNVTIKGESIGENLVTPDTISLSLRILLAEALLVWLCPLGLVLP